MNNPRRILLFTGDGKGKTTAALGMALRAHGRGMRILILQFMKADDTVGEIAALRELENMEIVQLGKGFVPPSDHPKYLDHVQAAQQGLEQARAALQSCDYDLVILDEICTAVSKGLLAEDDAVLAIKQADPRLHIVLTGRGAGEKLIALADTVTEMRCIKHGYESDLPATIGIEF